MFKFQRCFLFAALSAAALPAVVRADPYTPGPGLRYATDAYPGFDSEDEIFDEGRKTPRWFGWINGPKAATAAEQLAWAKARADAGDWGAARKGYDALVRAWPSSAEAPLAQKALADVLFEHDLEYDRAFDEYRYLLDYYSTECDFDAVASRLYEVARMMREAGKDFMFFHFDNTVDVRRAFEAVVLRAPGASYAPAAMVAVGELREDEGEFEKAVQAYETLRNLYPHTVEAKASVAREARVRMKLLKEHDYNRPRCLDTIGFLKQATTTADAATRPQLEAWLDEAVALLEDEAYRAAKFYDSRTRTRRSAINAYERFLKEYPASVHVEEARARLTELQQEGK